MTSVIVLTYNSQRYIEKIIKSIYEFNPPSRKSPIVRSWDAEPFSASADFSSDEAHEENPRPLGRGSFNKSLDYEVIIVDNNSFDGTVEKISRLKGDRPLAENFKVIENKENLGFAAGINIGAKAAKGEYLLFINPDTEWKEGSIDDLVSVFKKNPKIGVIGGKILTKGGSAEKSAGKFFKIFEVLLMSLGLDELFGIRSSPQKFCEVDFVSGGFMMVRSKLFKRFLFDENFFMYVEDMEFCFRVKRNGYKVCFSPDIVVVHEGHGSSNRSFAIKNIYKGIVYFHKKHGGAFSYLMVKNMLFIKALLLLILGRIINNRYLRETYSEALSI